MQKTWFDYIADGRRAVRLVHENKAGAPGSWLDARSDLIKQEVDSWPWMLREWRQASIPDWRRILVESNEKGDRGRAAYAVWMLEQVLLDPECLIGQGGIRDQG